MDPFSSVLDGIGTATPYILEASTGWSFGHVYGEMKKQEDEIKQGASYYFSSLFQIQQMSIVAGTFSQIWQKTLTGTAQNVAQVFTQIIPFLYIPVVLVAGVVKADMYNSGADFWNQHIPFQIPTELSEVSQKIFGFIAEYGGDILRVAMVVAGIALAALGQYAMGVALLTGIAYGILDAYGLIPHEISLFMERYVLVLSDVGLLFQGSVLSKILGVVHIASTVACELFQDLYFKVDTYGRKLLKLFDVNIEGALMEECFAPEENRFELPFEQIESILATPSRKIVLDLAHCTKGAIELSCLPSDREFEKYLNLFDAYDWTTDKSYGLLLSKFKVDANFLTFLRNKYTVQNADLLEGSTLAEQLNTLDSFIVRAADEDGVTKQEYLRNKAREQLHLSIRQLNGEIGVPIQGSRMLLEEAISYYAPILSYLESLKEGDMHKQDILLKLAVEGGGYCTRGMRDASEQVVSEIVQVMEKERAKASGEKSVDEAFDPFSIYVGKIRSHFLDARRDILNQGIACIVRLYSQTIQNDRDLVDTYAKMVGLGFVPMNRDELHKLGFMGVINSWYTSLLRETLFSEYKDYVKNYYDERETSHFNTAEMWVALSYAVQNNSKLSEEQKAYLLGRMQEPESLEDRKRWYTLMLVMAGVCKCSEEPKGLLEILEEPNRLESLTFRKDEDVSDEEPVVVAMATSDEESIEEAI